MVRRLWVYKKDEARVDGEVKTIEEILFKEAVF